MAPEDRGPELATVVSVLLGVSAVTVALRCYVRICLLKIFRIEDWLALLALASSIAFTYFVLISIRYGAGKHTAVVPTENIPKVLKMRWAGELTYVVTSMLLKLTVGIFLLRICSQMWHRITIWFVLITCLVFNVFYVFIAAFQCDPIDYYWYRYTTDITGVCVSAQLISRSTYASVGVNAAADWALGLFPIALVWNLDLNRKSKISVAGILALGSLASTATIVRIFYVWQLNHDKDLLYNFTDLAIWSTVENGLALTASSVATLRPLFKNILDPITQNRVSWPAIRRASSNALKFHCRGPSADIEIGDPCLRMGAYPPPGTARARYYRQSDGSEFDGSRSSSLKHSWHSFHSYKQLEDLDDERGRYTEPSSPRSVRSGWHSDGTRRLYGNGMAGFHDDIPPPRPARPASLSF
ncbi:hypothetical protein F5Y18DRAFT_238083 [Xylariaceae sp. FL1019]|nr:hypothetical protein F5Y18DRAFT_238083 [Xylariaceae sp. FL1019]